MITAKSHEHVGRFALMSILSSTIPIVYIQNTRTVIDYSGKIIHTKKQGGRVGRCSAKPDTRRKPPGRGAVWDRRGRQRDSTASQFFAGQIGAWTDMGGGWVSPAGGLDDDDHDDVLATSWGGGSWDDTAAT